MLRILLVGCSLLLGACAAPIPEIPVDSRSVAPGSSVMRGSDSFKLLGTPLRVGDPLPSVVLYNRNLQAVDLGRITGEVLVISVVPSIDTQVCERQTHLFAEPVEPLPEGVRRITISRDLPFAQKRFSEELPALGDLDYLSDFADAEFGQATGLLIEKIRLLARAVIVVDRAGIVRYLQVVPSIGHLPDLPRAFAFARQLVKGSS